MASRHVRCIIAALILLLSPSGAAPAADRGPREVIEQFHAVLLEVWRQSESLTIDQRFERLDPPVRATFDAAGMMAVAAGSAWRKADAGERDRLQEAFLRYTTSTYADRFTGYTSQSFRTGGERAGPDNQVIVETAIVRADASTVGLDYVLRSGDDGWRVIDILADGVSELAVLRADYRQTLRAGGIDALINALADLADKRLGR